MTSSKGRRPSPAMIVALAALVVALAGTAMAAPTAIKSILNKKEKKQVKNISKNQVNALAPGLSVKHADTAGSADRAKQADNADALSGITVVGTADIEGPGFLTNNTCVEKSKTVTGAKPGDHVVLTAPNGWPTYEKATLVAHVTADTVAYDMCNLTGAMQNYGTAPPVRALVFR
ncbi:MAG TPA: hypothetical protein VFN72_07735 [Solirubrobacterales bacterium]|nr:hypothetical protein [Solirubrobacterales bacterium]